METAEPMLCRDQSGAEEDGSLAIRDGVGIPVQLLTHI